MIATTTSAATKTAMITMAVIGKITITIIKIAIVALKGANRYSFYSPHCTTNCLQHEPLSDQDAIMCKTRATYPALVTCTMPCATPHQGIAKILRFTECKSYSF